MAPHPQCLDHMLAAWNEADQGRVRDHLERAISRDVRFVDPSIDLTGIDAFEDNIRAVRASLPGAVYSRTSAVDSQHGFHRYHWAIHREGRQVLSGFDVTQTNGDGLAICVIGFFGDLPNESSQ